MDRDAGLDIAIGTSIRAVLALRVALVAGGLLLGSLHIFVGLILVIPVLGHSTWHLYRKLIAS